MSSDISTSIFFDSGTITPLPLDAKRGIIAIALFGILSFVCCGLLTLYISYRLLVSWRRGDDKNGTAHAPGGLDTLDMTLNGAIRPSDMRDIQMREGQMQASRDAQAGGGDLSTRGGDDSHSFLTLIHNLLMADMFQSFAFMLSANWWRRDGIYVPSLTCTAQAFFTNLGSVSIALFLIALSANTLLTIVWGCKFSRVATRAVLAITWTVSFALAFANLGIASTTSSENEGWYYARSLGQCWINRRYPSEGLWLQNFWIILSILITVICYAWTLITLCLKKQSPRHLPPRNNRGHHHHNHNNHNNKKEPLEPSGYHPAFLIYPVIYILCSAPITITGIMSLGGSRIDLTQFTFAAVISSLVGTLDAILWSSTIVFSTSEQLDEVGLSKYGVMRTPDRVYGNMVWVEGATGGHGSSERMKRGGRRNWWKLNGNDGGLSTASDMENAIRMDTIMSITVERDIASSERSTKSLHLQDR